MRNPNLVLQNTDSAGGSGAESNSGVAGSWPKQSQRTLTPQETDLLLTDSLWSRRARVLVDNHSSDFPLFRIR